MESKLIDPRIDSTYRSWEIPFNRTSMESKLWLGGLSRYWRLPFNRTSMDIDTMLIEQQVLREIHETFNRTSIESKRGFPVNVPNGISTFNRTSMESKLPRP